MLTQILKVEILLRIKLLYRKYREVALKLFILALNLLMAQRNLKSSTKKLLDPLEGSRLPKQISIQ